MTDDWLEERLANRRKPDDPDYDAFYDATDDDLAELAHEALLSAVDAEEGATDGQ